LLAPCPTPKLEDHPLSTVRDCLFNILAATLHIGGRSSATWGCAMPWWQGPTYFVAYDRVKPTYLYFPCMSSISPVYSEIYLLVAEDSHYYKQYCECVC
jgi:hypothetical protein